MKIVYCIHSLFNSGGMERVLTNKANFLVNNIDCEIKIVTTEQENKLPFYELDPKIEIINLDINYSKDNSKNVFSKIINTLVKFRKHKKLLNNFLLNYQPDTVISLFGNEAYFLYQLNLKSKIILEIHFSKNFRLQLDRKGIRRIIDVARTFNDQRIAKKYNDFIVLTNEDKKRWKCDNINVIHNASFFKPERQSSNDNKIVLCVARFTYQKGLDILLNCWSHVVKKHKDWKLCIIGDGEEKQNLITLINTLQINDSVEIKPPTQNIELEYINSSIYIMTSRYEGMPMVLIEAMACGLPVVSFACQSGPSDIISNGIDGYLVENRNEEQLIQKLEELITNNHLRKEMGKNAIKKSMNFDQSYIMEKWIKLINTMDLK
ncbi:glycosyltransferase family 4 protein [Macellibacteroides fermentans]|uniref:Glycosyltransferase involved in cell wall bisynthesis n=1 Tax=Parabacteroides chartae TaxID=1037355 RepID=A0A1T5AQZ5_9BACT|nr:glycosyltransferase family 4 protein [Parabacteroides chartae]SKB37023.1 Glycosyltransferase involved in cell wall bisynthesis [Parabacteroides chartae]